MSDLPTMATPVISAIALDLGTTAIKAGLLDSAGNLINMVAQAAPEVAGDGGRYESDALAYAQTAEQVLASCRSVYAAALPGLALGMCCQRSSFLIWVRASGQPATPLISWQDTRGIASCEALQDSEGLIHARTGLRLAPYYFAPKLRVMLNEHPDWRAPLERGEWLVGTLDTFLIWRWSGGRHHVTDASMAARMLLMDIGRQCWSPELCALFGIPVSMLPRIRPSAGMNLLLDELPATCGNLLLQASLGDQSAALIASVGEDRPDTGVNSSVLVNLGTGGFAMRYLSGPDREGGVFDSGDAIRRARVLTGLAHQEFHPHLNPPPQGVGNQAPSPLREKGGMGVEADDYMLAGYLRTLVYRDSHTHFAIEGTLNSIAAALAPYPVDACSSADLGQGEIFCLAEPSGLGAPYFRNDIGIRLSAPVAHLTAQQIGFLLLEGIIFRVARMLEDFHRASPIERVYLSGGLSELACLQQGIALFAPCDVFRLQQKDASLLGAALLASGVSVAPHRDAEKIVVTPGNPALPEKYRRWKEWFDALLQIPPP